MPSKMYNKDSESAEENQKNPHVPKVGIKNTKKSSIKSTPKQSRAYSPFVFADEVDEDKLNSVLVNDGHIVAKSVEVVRSRSKVSTEFSKSKISRDEYSTSNPIGKKTTSGNSNNIKELKHNLGFNLQHFGRKFAVLVAALAIFGVVLVSVGSTWILQLWNNTPELEARPFESSVVYARDGKTELFKYYIEERREIIDLCTDDQEKDLINSANCIPMKAQLAAISLEDENFYYNEDGIPWSNIAGAAFDCLQSAGDSCRGGSGLSQQLVKNVTKEDDFSLQRKITELLTAIKLNQQVTKQDILFLYLNQVAFGRNAYGIQEGAKSYLGKDAKDLSIAESCYIAALVQKPTTFNSAIDNRESQDWRDYINRKNTCLQKLNELQLQGSGTDPLVNDEQLVEFEAVEPIFIPKESDFPFPHFRDYVTKELQKFRLSEQALATQGYKIITTLDPDIQIKTENSIKELEQTSVLDNGANNVAAIVLDGPTGEILAMVGSRDYNNTEIDGQVNIATSPQQPGSSIKPYVYAAALNQGFNPGTILEDVPTNFDGGFRPKNYSGTFVGAVSFRNALQNSYNIPAVKAAYLAAGEGDMPDGQTGINEVFRFSESMGLEYPCIDGAFNNNPVFVDSVENCTVGAEITPQVVKDAYKTRCYVGSAIGGCEVTMLSHITGINTIAQDGNLKTATPFVSIVNTQTGRDIYKENIEGAAPLYPKVDAAIDPLIARQMSTILSDYRARYTAFGTRLASNLELDGWTGDNAVAAKTGTTDQVRDTWTVGYTPYYSVAVWVGNTDNSPMKDNASSASAPAPIWKSIMTFLHQGKEPKGGSREGLQQVRLSTSTGFPVDSGGYVEWLTPKQIEVLGIAQAVLAKPEFDPTKSSIFTNRSPVVSRNLKVNALDGLIADTNLTLDKYTTPITCVQTISEFPLDPAWTAAIKTGSNCPTKITDQNQVSEQNNPPAITTNMQANNKFVTKITINTQVNGSNQKSMRLIQLFIDGVETGVAIDNQKLEYTIPIEKTGPHDVKIVATDSWGISKEISIPGAILEIS